MIKFLVKIEPFSKKDKFRKKIFVNKNGPIFGKDKENQLEKRDKKRAKTPDIRMKPKTSSDPSKKSIIHFFNF